MTHRRGFRVAIMRASLPAAICAVLAQAHAQEQGNSASGDQRVLSQIEEVIVTAQRREQNLQDVPFAVTAFDETTIARRQIDSVNQIRTMVPNLNYEAGPGQSTSSKIFYRGIGEDEALFTTDTPVGVYIDDVYIPRTTGSMFDLYGVERIEFLRGPQGTLYGRNTSAGALKIVTKKPTDTFSVDATAKVGNHERFDATASVNMPLNDTFAMQVSALRRSQEGSTRNRVNDMLVNDQDVWAGRVSLRATPSDDLDILVVADKIRERSIAGWLVGLTEGYEPGRSDIDGDGSFRTTNSDLVDPINDLDQGGVSATISWTMPWATLKSISAYRQLENTLLIDIDGVGEVAPGTPLFHLFQDQEQNQFSQELQASGTALDDRMQFVTGVYYFHEENDQHTTNLIFCGLDTCDFTRVGLDTDSIAVFGNLTYNLTQALSVTAGLRWTKDTKDFDLALFDAAGQPRLNDDGSPVARNIEESWDDWTPRAAVDYKLTGEGWSALLYANVAKGFKSGSFDGRAADPVTINSLVPVDPETNWNIEGGVKSDLLSNRLRLNVNYYWAEYEDLQLGIARLNQPNTRFNAGDVRVTGIEIEATAVPVDGLEITAQLGTIDGEYTRIASNVSETCSNANAVPLTFEQLHDLDVREAPSITGRLGATYSFAAPKVGLAGGIFTVGASIAHTDDHFHDFCNSRNIKTEAFELLDAQVSYETDDGRWRIAVGGTNLLDETYIRQGFNVGDGPNHFIQSAVFAEPRKYGVTFTYSLE